MNIIVTTTFLIMLLAGNLSNLDIFSVDQSLQQETGDDDLFNKMDLRGITYGTYHCDKKQCPRKDLSRISFTPSNQYLLLFLEGATGFIRNVQWTSSGTVLNIEWDDGSGYLKNEKLILNVLDSKHISLTDQKGKVNQYRLRMEESSN